MQGKETLGSIGGIGDEIQAPELLDHGLVTALICGLSTLWGLDLDLKPATTSEDPGEVGGTVDAELDDVLRGADRTSDTDVLPPDSKEGPTADAEEDGALDLAFIHSRSLRSSSHHARAATAGTTALPRRSSLPIVPGGLASTPRIPR